MNTKNYKSFSIRHGYEEPKSIQHESMDEDLRNGLWNVFCGNFPNSERSFMGDCPRHLIFHVIWFEFLHKRRDEYEDDLGYSVAKDIFLNKVWHEVFSLIEFVIRSLSSTVDYRTKKNNFINECNRVLAQENSAYKIVGECVTDITNQQEIESIENAMDTPYQGTNEHIEKALSLFSRRKNPDYLNSIKESISAVESIAKVVTGERCTLGELAPKLPLQHPAFSKALKQLYGFTSDAGGIRHAHSGEPLPPSRNTARFMLITCSAFVNYIVAENPET